MKALCQPITGQHEDLLKLRVHITLEQHHPLTSVCQQAELVGAASKLRMVVMKSPGPAGCPWGHLHSFNSGSSLFRHHQSLWTPAACLQRGCQSPCAQHVFLMLWQRIWGALTWSSPRTLKWCSSLISESSQPAVDTNAASLHTYRSDSRLCSHSCLNVDKRCFVWFRWVPAYIHAAHSLFQLVTHVLHQCPGLICPHFTFLIWVIRLLFLILTCFFPQT